MGTQLRNDNVIASSNNNAPALIQYALRGLRSCWMPEIGRWSYIYHLDGRSNPSVSIPASDVFYSLNVLVGLARIAHYGKIHDFDLRAVFGRCATEILKHNTRIYAYGTALWASAELGLDLPGATSNAIVALAENKAGWSQFRAQDLGMLLAGAVKRAEREPGGGWADVARGLFSFLVDHFSCSSGLFYDAPRGWRRNFSSFATHTYLTLASYIYGEWSGDERAITLANHCTRKLIELQGPQGEWPWFFHTPSGRVVDFYEVYSVHQEGMAPAFLLHADFHGVQDARKALVRGFKWILGQNQLDRPMLWKKEGLICRSQVRRGELNRKYRRVGRAILKAINGTPAKLAAPTELELRLECRSYELGWILYSFGPRADFLELQQHSEFAS